MVDQPNTEVQGNSAFSITTNDSADVSKTGCNLYIGGAGDVKVDMVGIGTVTFSGVGAGTFMPIKISRVYSTGTTATLILGVY